MVPTDSPAYQELLRELDRRREDERDEREERRGLENRASALLAAGAAVIGLVATAVKDFNVSGAGRDALFGFVGLASLVMVISFGYVVAALRGRPVFDLEPETDAASELRNAVKRVAEIQQKNLRMLRLIRQGTLVFGFSVALFTGIVFWAAVVAKAPSTTRPRVVVRVVHGPRGPRGLRGPRGPRG